MDKIDNSTEKKVTQSFSIILRIALSTIEYVFYVGFAILIASGSVDAVLSEFSFTPFITFGILGILVVLLLIIYRFNPIVLNSSRVMIFFTLLVILVVHISLDTTYRVQNSPLFVFYYILVILFGCLGRGMLLVSSFSFLCISEYGYDIYQLLTTGDYKEFLSQIKLISTYFLPVVACGVVCYVLCIDSVRNTQRSTVQMLHKNMARDSGDDVLGINQHSAMMKTSQSVQIYSEQITMKGDELESIVFFMSKMLSSFSALSFIYDPLKEVFILNAYKSKSVAIIPKVQIPKGSGVIGAIAIEKNAFLSGNITNYEQSLLYYAKTELVNSILAVPILSNSELLGALIVDSKDKLAFRDKEKDLLMRFSHPAAAVIINIKERLYKERVAFQNKQLYEAGQLFASVSRPDKVLEIVVSKISSLNLPLMRITLIDFNPETNTCRIDKIFGKSAVHKAGYTFALNDGLCSYAIRTKKRALVEDFLYDRKRFYLFVPDEKIENTIRSVIILPLVIQDSNCRGLVCIESVVPHLFRADIGWNIEILINNASVAYQKALLYQKMEMLATTDGLTLLYNHRIFQDKLHAELDRSERYQRCVSLLLMDIDFFKKFNDTYGHTIGDLVLREIALCIRKTIRTIDIAARYGGEEFAVIMPETDTKGALNIGERIRRTIEGRIIHSQAGDLRVTVSIGCATYPVHSNTQKDLIDKADIAMYFSKQQGRNQIHAFHTTMSKEKKASLVPASVK